MTYSELELWQPKEIQDPLSNLRRPAKIVSYALRLSDRDKNQIVQGFKSKNFEMVVNFIWIKAMASLKRELATVGIAFLCEMLDRLDLSEDGDVIDSISDREAIRLAQELGVVSPTDAIRLRHSQELVAHFSGLDPALIDEEDVIMDELEAVNVLKICTKTILGKPKIEVATEFVDFREALESQALSKNDPQIESLLASPYFFKKLTLSILLSIINESSGARLEHALANINLILPLLWDSLRDTEKWQVGRAYAEVHANGRTTSMVGLSRALIKVNGFDFVPESLRSNTYIKAAKRVIAAHEGISNFYRETSRMKVLNGLGTTIPAPAFSICATALLAVCLGNSYGKSWDASSIARNMMDKFTIDRWEYYINQCLPGDIRILDKLRSDKPKKEWYKIVIKYELENINANNKYVKNLISNSMHKDGQRTKRYASLLIQNYYGKKKGV